MLLLQGQVAGEVMTCSAGSCAQIASRVHAEEVVSAPRPPEVAGLSAQLLSRSQRSTQVTWVRPLVRVQCQR